MKAEVDWTGKGLVFEGRAESGHTLRIDGDKIARAVELSHEKYCSASAMFGTTATLTHSLELIEAELTA